MAAMPAEERTTAAGQRALKVMNMALAETHIAFTAIETVQALTLIFVGDTDLVRTEHAVAIFLFSGLSDPAVLMTHRCPGAGSSPYPGMRIPPSAS